MCGFVGGTDPDWDYAAALRAIAHRGPDASELRLDGPVRVGFRRLSIIDLRPSANQPMMAPDGASWIVFNGEIYGYRELRSSLERRGHEFLTDSDTEVALHAYLEWGTRIALGNSQEGAHVVEHAPVPRWGWGEAPPYQP